MAAAEYHALLDACVDAIVVIDERGRIATFNAAAERLFGYPAADVLGKNVSLLMPEPDRSRHDGYMQHYRDTGERRVIGIGREVLGRHADGSTLPISLSVGEANDAEGRRFVGVIRDLRSQRAAEQRVRALDARLAHLGRFNLLGEMAAGIAHEINQPLSAIATYAQAAKRIIAREADKRTFAEICDKIDDQARRAGEVIHNLRKFIRKQEIETQRLAINAVVGDVLNLIEADAHAEGIRVRTEFAEGLAAVRGNAVQLQQVLLNLTRNAVDAMRGTLAKGKGIVISTAAEGDGVRVAVADHGHGVSRQLGDNVFHPFVSTKREGLGVGLAISRTIVQSYGGTLTYHDNPDGGTVFEMRLPPAEESEAGEGAPPGQKS